MKKIFLSPLLFFFIVLFYFYKSFFLFSLFPIPSDTIIGLYHPYRDVYAKEYPRGIPYKNSLITDPVVQQLPWRFLAIEELKKMQLPLWNPYSMAGVPLFANIQTAALYPLNILFFVLPFSVSWSVLIIIQQVLGGIFLYFYLKNKNLDTVSSLLGSLAFSFSGFFIAWLEWGTIVHTVLWLPLILLCVDKITIHPKDTIHFVVASNFQFPISKKILMWSFVYLVALCSSLFAGHLQTFVYVFLISWVYFLFRWIEHRSIRLLTNFLLLTTIFIIITAVQWIPLLQLLLLSARNIDLSWHQDGWFIPWGQLIQFIVPDYFGNPATGNYFGTWNYGEFVGYIGIIPFILALYALLKRREKDVFFWGSIVFIGILFSTGSIIGKLPYLLNIPFLSSTQPTRIMAIIDLALAILSAYGFDYLQRKEKSIVSTLCIIGGCFVCAWGSVLFLMHISPTITAENMLVIKRNLILPTVLFLCGGAGLWYITTKKTVLHSLVVPILFIILACDLLYFGNKFTPFTKPEYLFPQTKILSFLQSQRDITRVMTTDSRILPPNFSLMYKIQSVDGYDPLYLMRYGELMAASGRQVPNIEPPFGFSRIVTPHWYDSRVINLMGVRYILTFDEISRPEYVKILTEGTTQLYLNPHAFPRAFFVERVISVSNKQEAIKALFDVHIDLASRAIVEESENTLKDRNFIGGSASITTYTENSIVVETNTPGESFLVLTDTFYPTWHAYIDGKETKIYRTDYHFRGVIIPSGKHRVEYKVFLL